MSTGEKESSVRITLPLWQVMLVLIGLPALYMGNSLLPWSIGLLRRHDHAFFMQFWVSIAVLHWSSVTLVLILLKRAGRGLADIGLKLSPFRLAAMVGIPVVVGVALTVLHGVLVRSEPSDVYTPATMGERLFWIFSCFTAGFCEELVYRGFIIRVLQGRNIRTWLAVSFATLAFVLMHGINVLRHWFPFFPILYIVGLLFSALFLWRRSLVPGIYLHTLFDLVQQ